MLNAKEKYKLEIIRSAVSGKITNCEVSKLLSVSGKTSKRLKKSVRKLGTDGVIHKLKIRLVITFLETLLKTGFGFNKNKIF